MKTQISLSIEQKIIQKAHELGLNISKVAELALIKKIQLLEQDQTVFSSGFSAEKSDLVRSPGFEPGSSAWEGTVDDWNHFRESLKNYRGSYASTIYNYAYRFSGCLFSRDLSRIRELSESMKPQVLKALSALAKFAGCYEDYKGLIKNYGLRWVGRSTEDLIIDRLTRTKDPDNLWKWIKTLKDARPDLTELLDLLAVTGLRLEEAFHCYNLIIELTKAKSLTEKYYNVKTGMLEHFRFKEYFIRSSKKAYVSYVPLELLERIGTKEPFPATYSIRKRVAKLHMPQRFSDIREAHATFLTAYLKVEEIDFLHGRCGGSVFMKHYYNPAMITDLRQRLNEAIRDILEKISVRNTQLYITQTSEKCSKIR